MRDTTGDTRCRRTIPHPHQQLPGPLNLLQPVVHVICFPAEPLAPPIVRHPPALKQTMLALALGPTLILPSPAPTSTQTGNDRPRKRLIGPTHRVPLHQTKPGLERHLPR
ncbi:hypothetical protein PAXRUDRAFT_511153 [Paxillus rubicundulus Ve08.2h10]|uniref:Uncharacterized protein n=1 Tax=Paxillus rubicundulus Ve08.2h10 TaxID=930991 RepID=A0A0D0CV81_9AGAM|nr:hypothetical protein PAXRUDRAFT_511153 [Paxillus rubicundulus Ve08.2h10]